MRQPWLLRLCEMLFNQSGRYRRLSVPLAEVARDGWRALMTAQLELTAQVLLAQSWLTGAAPGRV